MNDGFDVEEVKYLINKWYYWKGIAIGGFIMLITLTLSGLLIGK